MGTGGGGVILRSAARQSDLDHAIEILQDIVVPKSQDAEAAAPHPNPLPLKRGFEGIYARKVRRIRWHSWCRYRASKSISGFEGEVFIR
jgi:hypothetical protein